MVPQLLVRAIWDFFVESTQTKHQSVSLCVVRPMRPKVGTELGAHSPAGAVCSARPRFTSSPWRGPSGEHEMGLAKLSSLPWSCRGFISSPVVYKFTEISTKIDGICSCLFSKITGDNAGICGFGSWFDVDWQAGAGFLSPNCRDLLRGGYFS